MKINNTVAFIYDFDGTLSPGNMQEYEFIPQLKKSPAEFWAASSSLSQANRGDDILSYMFLMKKEADYHNIAIKKDSFHEFGKKVELYPGVQNWFPSINLEGIRRNLKIEHYIISSGLREMIEGTPIAHFFKKIYASAYLYDQNDVAVWPAQAVNYTTKTQYLFRINKDVHDEWDTKRINAFIPEKERNIPFSRMIYLGDGTTDIPCMKLVKEQGGHSLAVYNESPGKNKTEVLKLLAEGRANYIIPANYQIDSKAFATCVTILDKIEADCKLQGLNSEE